MHRLTVVCWLLLTGFAQAAEWPGTKSSYHDFERYDFVVDGCKALVVVPKEAAAGRPWIWRAEFFDHRPETDLALLGKGFHLAYIGVGNTFGCPDAMAHWDVFYRTLTAEHGLSATPALEGLSRGGLYCFNWAAAHPDQVGCIYADNAVMDFKSWPAGKGKGKGSPKDWAKLIGDYHFASEAEALAYAKNPVDNLAPLAAAKVPLLLLCADADDVVPFPENGAVVQERYQKLGGPVQVIVKKGLGHHPHGLDDPRPIVAFVIEHVAAVPKTSAARPMRPLPQAARRPLAAGPKRFVDAGRGDDGSAGDEQHPWKTLAHALRRLQPGDTLYLRGGVYYEKPALTRSGTAEQPITIASYPGELAILDGGLREFLESPATAWQPLDGGAAGEFVSTKTYFEADDRQVPQQFLPGAWEPMQGIEEERPIALGNFADSMVPLHGYRLAIDLRADNEFWLAGKKEMRDTGIYCGPGLWFNRDTGRIHVRLAPTQLPGLGERAYRGETDPRKVPLVVAAGFGHDVLRASGIKHVRLQGLVLRGATGSPLIHVYGSEHIELDHLTAYGGFPGQLIDASKDVKVAHCAFRGLAAPWTSRAHMKYRGTASYQIVLQNHQPLNENLEFAWCEFTDDHDFAFLRYAKNLHFHHNYIDNFNDDGLECGPKLRAQTILVHENRIGRCLSTFTQHENEKDESPLDNEPDSGLYVFRNVIDTRGGVYNSPPAAAEASGAFLHFEGHLLGDHGSPIYPLTRFYHNTVLRHTPAYRDLFLFGMAVNGLRHSECDVFNNVFVQTRGLPGANFTGIKGGEDLREGGNLLWGVDAGPAFHGDLFAKFRASPLFAASRERYKPGWTTNDLFADPKFVRLPSDESLAADLQLAPRSPAVNAGQELPSTWPDPLRAADAAQPDCGALPQGIAAWHVGVDGRVPLCEGFAGP